MGRITYLRKPGKVSSGRVNGRRAMNGSLDRGQWVFLRVEESRWLPRSQDEWV